MPSNVTISVYLGSGDKGQKLYEKVMKECTKRDISVSEFIKGLLEKELPK